MFQRLDAATRDVLVLAQEEGRALGHGHVGTEHLLLGLLRRPGTVAAAVLAEAGAALDDLRSAVERNVGRGLPGPDDAAALRAIGIDINLVRASIEEAFGPGALDRACRSWRHGRRGRRCRDTGSGTPLTPRAKRTLELALRESLRMRQRHIGPEHLLLGLLAEDGGMAAKILVDRGFRPADLRRRVLVALGRVA